MIRFRVKMFNHQLKTAPSTGNSVNNSNAVSSNALGQVDRNLAKINRDDISLDNSMKILSRSIDKDKTQMNLHQSEINNLKRVSEGNKSRPQSPSIVSLTTNRVQSLENKISQTKELIDNKSSQLSQLKEQKESNLNEKSNLLSQKSKLLGQ